MRILITLITFILIGCSQPAPPEVSNKALLGVILIIQTNPSFFGEQK